MPRKDRRRFESSLKEKTGIDFQRACLDVLQIIWPEMINSTALKAIDRAGIDHLIWDDTGNFPVVIQCKGFQVQHPKGDQIRDAKDSINDFANSSHTTQDYIFLINRTVGTNNEFRVKVEKELENLVAMGKAITAELWDLDKLLKIASDQLRTRILANFAKTHHEDVNTEFEPIEEVPLQVSELSFVPHYFELGTIKSLPTFLADPAAELLNNSAFRLTVMIGNAGFGKTTAAQRVFKLTNRSVLYTPATSYADTTKDLLMECVDLEQILDDLDAEHINFLMPLIRSVVMNIMTQEKPNTIWVIDGLDESPYFMRRNGLNQLLSQLSDVRMPVVLLARSEYWKDRQQDFKNNLQIELEKQFKRNKVRLIELVEWEDKQIRLLAERYRDKETNQVGKSRINELIASIDNGTFQIYFSDIPRRPLFMQFILDTVVETELRYFKKAELFYFWAYRKIYRDIFEPAKYGLHRLREGIVSDLEASAETIRLSFKAMKWGAYCMTDQQEGELILLPSCKRSDILLCDARLGILESNATPLYLNSLLEGIPSLPHQDPLARFSHRAFQEFFLSLYLHQNPSRLTATSLPETIVDYLQDLQQMSTWKIFKESSDFIPLMM